MNSQKQVIALIKSFSGQANVLTIPRVYVDILKSHRAALLLSQCVYWSDKTKDPEGWFYKTYGEWKEELGMNQGAIDTAMKSIGKYVSVKVKKVGATPKRHYRVSFDLLVSDISDLLETYKSDLSETNTSDLPENNKSSYTEITTEITTEIARKEPAPTPPAITTFRENAKAFPSKAQWPAIEKAIGDSSAALELWGRVVAGYILCGWNPRNVSGMLDFFKRGEIPNTNGKHNSGSEPAGWSGLREWASENGVAIDGQD